MDSSTPISNTASAEAFAAAFNEAQHVISDRGRTGWIWPLFEIFKDKSAEHMKVVDAFLEPILKEALSKKERRLPDGKDTKENDETDEDETLLDHLVKFTSGAPRCYQLGLLTPTCIHSHNGRPRCSS